MVYRLHMHKVNLLVGSAQRGFSRGEGAAQLHIMLAPGRIFECMNARKHGSALRNWPILDDAELCVQTVFQGPWSWALTFSKGLLQGRLRVEIRVGLDLIQGRK